MTINDLFEAGLENSNLNLIYKLNEKNKVAVITPHGLTERVEINKIVMQGENLAPLECSVQVDSYGKECMDEEKYLYYYREKVPVPGLSMVDDLLCISRCGVESVLMNAFINAKSNMKKLQFGESKCHKIHIGKDKSICPDLYIDKWKVEGINKEGNNQSSLGDVHDCMHLIKDSKQEKYLGDLIDDSGKNDANIDARVKKGLGIIKQINAILEDMCFGKHFFKVAKILRESLFLNSILLNSEAWCSVSKKNIEELERIDNTLLKNIFQVPTSTPSLVLHLDLCTLPVRYVLMTRRLCFLQYLLKEDEGSLVSRVLMAQIENVVKGDWWESAAEDISELNLDLTLHEIKAMSKESFKTKVKEAATREAFKWLLSEKENKKKVKNNSYENFETN